MRSHLAGDDDDDDNDNNNSASLRERSYAQYKANLESAWRGQTYPRRAAKVEAQRERWLGKGSR